MKKLFKIYNGIASFIGHCFLAAVALGSLFIGYLAIADWLDTRKKRKAKQDFDDDCKYFNDPDFFEDLDEDDFSDDMFEDETI